MEGWVTGIDIKKGTGGSPQYWVSIAKEKGGPAKKIQVMSSHHNLQNLLEMALAKWARVEVEYRDIFEEAFLNRVRVLDRDGQPADVKGRKPSARANQIGLGYVSGLDAQAMPRQQPRCQAFISDQHGGGGNNIQVTTYHHNLQTALERACAANRAVRVTYYDNSGENTLTSVD